MYVRKTNSKKPQDINKIIGQFIREIRVAKSLTGEEFGQLIQLSQQQVSRYENGVTSFNIETLNRMLMALDSDWSEFYQKIFHVSSIDHINIGNSLNVIKNKSHYF